MKIVLVLLLMFTITANSKTLIHSFTEKNDLWKEDSLSRKANITEELFNKLIDVAYETYEPIAIANDDILVFNRDWNSSTVNAFCYRGSTKVIIDLLGGLARRKEMSPEGFALVICHELGHAYGGVPYGSVWNRMSIEGQSDYYATLTCANKLFANLNLGDSYTFEPTSFMRRACEGFNGDNEICLRVLTAGQSVANFLARPKDKGNPNYETPDKKAVKETNMRYPKPQCRLDTYFNGLFELKRPACWFKD